MAFLDNEIAPRLHVSYPWDQGYLTIPGYKGKSENWWTWLSEHSNYALYLSTKVNVDPSFVERVQAALLKRMDTKQYFWLTIQNRFGATVYKSPDFLYREMKVFSYKYVSTDFLVTKAVYLWLSKESQGVRLEGRIRLPFRCVQASNGRFVTDVQMLDPSCAKQQQSLLSRVTLAVKARVEVDKRSSNGFTEA